METLAEAEPGLIDEQEQKSSSRTYTAWIVGLLLVVANVSTLFAWFNFHRDLFGLHGRNPVEIYALERYSKYLMSLRYVPDQYDGILVSNSIAVNWDTGLFTHYRVFNAGLRGSTITEEKLIVDNAVNRGHMKIAIIVLLPSLTGSRGTRTAYMTRGDYYASFGSVQTLIVDMQAVIERIGPLLHLSPSVAAHKFKPDGAMNFPMAHDSSTVVPPLDEAEITGNPEAIEEFKQVLANLHAHGVKVYGVYPPLYELRWKLQGAELRSWQARTTALFSTSDTIIDLRGGELTSLEFDRESFPDYLHLAPKAASAAMAAVVARIEHR